MLTWEALAFVQLCDLIDNALISPSIISTDGVVTFDTANLLQSSNQEEQFYLYQVEFDFT